MGRFTITPWRTQADLLAVRAHLYGIDRTESPPDLRSQAVSRVMAWKLRGNLPHAVESTALLIDAIIHHSVPGNSIFSIRAVYSAAFTRFVTGFCDIGRNKERSLEPSSMLDIAKQIDMPVHFVALRHEATHEELPAVFRLVKATEEALQWLWHVYWNRLEEPLKEEDLAPLLPKMRAEAKQILRTYRSERLEALRSKKHQGQSAILSKTYDSFQRLAGNRKVKLEVMVNVLVEDGFLSPSKRELGSSLEGAFLLWDQLLKHLASVSGTFDMLLTEALLRAISALSVIAAEQDVENETLALWVLHVLVDDTWVQVRTSQNHDVLFQNAMIWCCLHSAYWTNYVGRKLLEAGDDDFGGCWRDIFQASLLGETQGVEEAVATRGSRSSSADHSVPTESSEGRRRWTRAVISSRDPIGVIAR